MKLPLGLGTRVRIERPIIFGTPQSLMDAIRHLDFTVRIMVQNFAEYAHEGLTAYFRKAGNSQCNPR
jgi:hypothetical protein